MRSTPLTDLADAEDFDYVVVGGGSSDCIIAEALSRSPHSRVLTDRRLSNVDCPVPSPNPAWSMRAVPRPWSRKRG